MPQIRSDLHPDVYAIVPDDGELRSRPIRDVLPSAYHRDDTTDRRQVVYFHFRHFDSIVAGRKSATVGFRDPLHVGPAVFVFDHGYTVRRLDGEVTRVITRRVATLTEWTPTARRSRIETSYLPSFQSTTPLWWTTM